ncbi:MAG: P-type conjugative transfer protein TrbL [Rhodopila sp.]|jgi:type IV secretion system protein TrbL
MALDAGSPDQIYQAFANHGPAIQAALVTGGNDLFAGLAVVELVWVVGWSVAHKNDIFDIMIVVTRMAIGLGFWLWMMQNWVQMAKAITDTFGLWGNSAVQAAGGTANMSPLDFINAGLDLGGAIWKAMSWREPMTGAVLLIAGLIDVVIFAWIAAQIMMVVIEALLASYLGTVLMAFNATSFTREFGSSPIRYAISVGMKRMTLQFIAGVAQGIVQGWATAIQNGTTPSWTSIGVMIAVPIMLVYVADKAPKIAQDLIIGSHLSTSQGIVNSVKQLASAAIALAAAVTGVGVAGVAAGQLAGRQTAAAAASGQPQGGTLARSATMARLTAQNMASGYQSDIGQRLSGQYQAQHGYQGFRVANELNKRENP